MSGDTAWVLWDRADAHSVDHKIRLLNITDDSPVPLDWTKPVYAQDGRRFIFNSDGYNNGRTNWKRNGQNRECWYGWLNEDRSDNGWWFENGEPANGQKVHLTNVAPRVIGLDADRPIIAVTRDRGEHPFHVVGKLEGTTHILGYWKSEQHRSTLLIVDLITAKVVSYSGERAPAGSGLTFKNVPRVRHVNDRLEGHEMPVIVTVEDGKVTNVRLPQD